MERPYELFNAFEKGGDRDPCHPDAHDHMAKQHQKAGISFQFINKDISFHETPQTSTSYRRQLLP
jgi:hypothetical protein